MDANTIIACIGMAYFCSKIINNNREDIKEMNTIHTNEMNKITDGINSLTIVIQKLVDKMGCDDHEN